MKKNLLWIILALAILIGGVYWYQQRKISVQSDNEVMVGVILPLTGASAELGKPIMEAMKIAENTVNNNHYLGDGKLLKLIFEDGQSTANGSMSAFLKLKNDNPNAFVVFGDVPVSNLASSFSSFDYPVIALAAAADNITSLSPHYFRAWTTTRASSEKLSEFAKTKLNLTKAAIFSVNNNYGEEFSKNLKTAYEADGGKVLIKETYDLSDNDVKSQIQKIINKKPDVVFVLGFGTGYLSAFNQLKSMGYKGVILTDETITISEYLQTVKDAVDNTYFCSSLFDAKDTVAISYKTLVNPMKESFGKEPNAHSVFGYVSVSILADAIKRKGSTAAEIETGLKSLKNYESIIGRLSYTEERELELPIVIRKINKDGSFSKIK